MAYLIGVDLGTSGTKTALFDERGRRIASRTVEYPLSQPKNGWAEQEPEHWWKAACETIRAVIAESGVDAGAIKGVGLSGQMHGLVMLDAAGQVLRPAILWCDGRTGEECREITERVGRQRLIDITANPALTGFTAGKILWVRKHEPENYERCRHILLPKDYLRYKLTGEFATEVSDVSGMNLLDVPKRQCLDILREMGTAPETVTACGGGARSAFWRQMLADALGCNIATSKLALEGAAILAGVCAGVYDNVADAADSIVSIDGENSPEPAMSERLNKIYALGAGLLLLGAAGVLIGLMPQFMAVGSYALMLGFSLIAGVGYISIDLLMNSVIADVYKERKNGVLPYVHAFYGAGAMLAPVFVTALVSLERPESFARPYLILGLLSLTCAALMLLTGKRMKPQTPYADMEEIRGRARQNPAEIFREGSAWLFLLSGFMNLSFQTGLTTWLPRYCSLVWDYDLTAAGLMVTMYFMGALVMRLLSPFVYRKLGVKRYYQLTLLVSAALYLVFLLLPMPDWCRKAMVFALGLLQGATVPTLVILCCDAFPERTASASSVVVTGVSLASMVSPVVLGKLLTIDPQTAMLSITVCTVIAALVLPKSKKA